MTLTTAKAVISRSLSRLVLGQPWFAALALRLDIRTDEAIPTAATDGVSLYYNPVWFASLDARFQEGVLAHEVMHCALLHMTRRGGRNPERWNMAGDHVINLELLKAGFTLPPGCLADPRFTGKSSEQVYAILEHEGRGKGGKGKQGAAAGGGAYVDPLGGVKDAPQGPIGAKDKAGVQGPGKARAKAQGPGDVEADWTIAVAQASMVAQKAGKLPGGADRAARDARESQEDYRSIMARYLVLPGDYAWTNPNRRMISRGLYLPGPKVDRPGVVDIVVDTSGSIGQELLDAFAAEATAILTAHGWPGKVRVTYCDAEIQGEEEIEEGEIKLTAKGGGGTACLPVFDRMARRMEEGEGAPAVLFYLTDLYIPDLHGMDAPGYPVVWVVPSWSTAAAAPWGETARVECGGGY